MEKRLNKYYNDNLFVYLDFLYYFYDLDINPPYMYKDPGFKTFCEIWNNMYNKNRIKRAMNIIRPAQIKFLEKYCSPRTELGEKRLTKSFNTILDDFEKLKNIIKT